MATRSVTRPHFNKLGALIPLSGTEDVHLLQDNSGHDEVVQVSLPDLMQGLVTSMGGKQTVTGAKGGNVALASLIAALVKLGFIIDTTTA